jgi:3-oxoacyl-[acyl-carrier protein] reductase
MTAAAGRLAGKVAVITGSGQGIGRAIAELFAREGAAVVVNALHAETAGRVVAAISAAGGQAVACVGDVRSPADAQRIVDTAAAHFGRLDILVNNAGFPLDAMVHKMTDAQWDDCVDVTLKGAFNCIRAAAPHMRREAHNGRIINVSAAAGLIGGPGMANYCAAKHGLHGLTKTIALEWLRYGVTCNAIAYGWVDTRLTGEREAGEQVLGHTVGIPKGVRDKLRAQYQGHPQTAGEAANTALLLALPEAQHVTATIVNATSGWLT